MLIALTCARWPGYVRDLLSSADADDEDVPDLDADDSGTGEGRARAHLRRERDPKLRRRKIADTKRRGLPLSCEVCTFDFSRMYGNHGADYIECHHRIPLHVTGETQTRLADLALLCSNCHRMIHRTKQWLTVEELQCIVVAQRRPEALRPSKLIDARPRISSVDGGALRLSEQRREVACC